MERCPVCRARISESGCGRCESDLSGLLQIEEQAGLLLQWAVQALAAGDIEKAHHLCNRSNGLKKSPLAKVFVGFLLSLSKADLD